MMGLIGLPISLFLYWLMLRSKKESPFPKYGLLRVLIAGAVSVVLSSIISMPVSLVLELARSGAFSDFSGFIQSAISNPEALKESMQSLDANALSATLWAMLNMFLSAGLLEEGLKYLSCRIAIRKEGMVRTWMDSVVAFAIVGITFEMLENITFGIGSEFIAVLFRALAPAHFVFGVVMGYFYGKYLVSGKKGYRLFSFFIPVIHHTVTNAFMSTMNVSSLNNVQGIAAAISHIVVGVITVIVVFYWQKKGKLDVPIRQKETSVSV